MKVWIGSEYDYNNGRLNGEWVELTGDYENDLQEVIDRYSYGGLHDVSVFDADIESDGPWSNEMVESLSLKQLEELVAAWEDMGDYDREKVKAAIEAYGDHTVVEIFDKVDDIEFWEDMDLEDVAEEFASEGYFGEIPERISYYIDYKAIARDLSCDGYCETSFGVVYMM